MSRALLVPAVAVAARRPRRVRVLGAGARDLRLRPAAVTVSSTKRRAARSRRRPSPAGPTTFTHHQQRRATSPSSTSTPRTAQRIVGEVENIGPGLTRDLTVVLPAGHLRRRACKPGRPATASGPPSRSTGDRESPRRARRRAALTKAAAGLQGVGRGRGRPSCSSGTTAFVAAVKAGDLAQAKALYAPTRMHWERDRAGRGVLRRPRPAASTPASNDVEAGEEWTGWHRIEKALWVDRSLGRHGPDRRPAARRHQGARRRKIGHDRRSPPTRSPTAPRSCSTRSPPARSRVRRSATPTPTSWDFQANVDGAQARPTTWSAPSSRPRTPRSRRSSTPRSPTCRRRSTPTGRRRLRALHRR